MVFLCLVHMESLEDKLKDLKMTEEEDEIIDCCDEEDKQFMQEQLNLCLIGKILTQNSFTVESMQSALKVAWRLAKGMIIREIDENIYMFQFFSMMDRNRVLEGGLGRLGVPQFC